jgi:hypothetical protein
MVAGLITRVGKLGSGQDAVTEILAGVAQPEPDRDRTGRTLATVKGFLAPIVTGRAAGAGVSAQDWARTAIEQLGNPL